MKEYDYMNSFAVEDIIIGLMVRLASKFEGKSKEQNILKLNGNPNIVSSSPYFTY